MASSATLVKLVCLAVVAASAVEALTCGQVVSRIAPCIGYLQSGGAVPGPCCSGVRSLKAAAKTSADRQTACKCLKAASASMKGMNLSLAAGLPGKCGVSVPYKISPSTDCNTVK